MLHKSSTFSIDNGSLSPCAIIRFIYSDELQFYIDAVMMDKTSRMDLSFFDSAKMGDKARHARNYFLSKMNMSWLVFDIIKDWENGYDSVLGRYYADNGKDLSGDHWQLVGLARAYFKDSEYKILDEPSAALDPISEDRIFEQLYHLSEGKSRSRFRTAF